MIWKCKVFFVYFRKFDTILVYSIEILKLKNL